VQENCAELIRQIAYLKKSGLSQEDPLETMRQLANRSVDTLTLLGGRFEEAVVVHAPKTIPEFMPDHLQARWRQQAAEAKLELAMPIKLDTLPNGKDKPLIKAPNQLPGDTQQRRMASYLMTRLLHLKTKAKLVLLQSDLQQFPAIANLKLHLQWSPLSLICSYLYYGEQEITATDIAKVLLDNGADINAQDRMGASALHYAARRGEESLIELLVSRGADINQRDKSGRSVIHWACTLNGERKISAVQAVLKHCKSIDVNRPDKKGLTPLHLAIMAKDKELVDLLLKAGANPTKKLWFWESPSAMARRYGDEALVSRLKEATREWRR
jgi:ankyrin repeat protein